MVESFGAKRARDEIHAFLGLFDVASVDRLVFDSALDIGFTDYEDAVLHEAARMAGVDAILTHDRDDYANAAILTLDPQELLAIIASSA